MEPRAPNPRPAFGDESAQRRGTVLRLCNILFAGAFRSRSALSAWVGSQASATTFGVTSGSRCLARSAACRVFCRARTLACGLARRGRLPLAARLGSPEREPWLLSEKNHLMTCCLIIVAVLLVPEVRSRTGALFDVPRFAQHSGHARRRFRRRAPGANTPADARRRPQCLGEAARRAAHVVANFAFRRSRDQAATSSRAL